MSNKPMTAAVRMYLTADRKQIVEAGHPKAGTLYATPGDNIPGDAVEKFDLVKKGFVVTDGELPAEEEKADDKAAKKASNKVAKKTSDKSGASSKGGPTATTGNNGG